EKGKKGVINDSKEEYGDYDVDSAVYHMEVDENEEENTIDTEGPRSSQKSCKNRGSPIILNEDYDT
ncbi:hypothetical protein PFISCL1PPCAC_17525, partial [Pristionchus fissidentatus]